MRTFSIVLADDEPQILHGMLGGIPWEQLGFSVAATAGNGQEALEYVQKLHPDCSSVTSRCRFWTAWSLRGFCMMR